MPVLWAEYWDPKKDKTDYVHQSGDELNAVSDVELGILMWMMALRRNDCRSQPPLHIPDGKTRDQIHFLRNCRNKLAHRGVCSPEKMRHLPLSFDCA